MSDAIAQRLLNVLCNVVNQLTLVATSLNHMYKILQEIRTHHDSSAGSLESIAEDTCRIAESLVQEEPEGGN